MDLKIQHTKYNILHTRSASRRTGAMAFLAIVITAGVIMEVAVAVVIVAVSISSINRNTKLGAEAYYVARSGANDAILRIIRYCPGASCVASYLLSVGSKTANIDICVSGSTYTVKSVGASSLRKKEIKVVATGDATTGEVFVQSFGEVALGSTACP